LFAANTALPGGEYLAPCLAFHNPRFIQVKALVPHGRTNKKKAQATWAFWKQGVEMQQPGDQGQVQPPDPNSRFYMCLRPQCLMDKKKKRRCEYNGREVHWTYDLYDFNKHLSTYLQGVQPKTTLWYYAAAPFAAVNCKVLKWDSECSSSIS
jgi:hypothetical protein